MRREVRKWSLKEDESDLDNVDANSVKSEEGGDAVDPLDVYIVEISIEVRKSKVDFKWKIPSLA